ncbi:hypothetical protein A3A49_00725 [Candidatus Curtissbacteria bacterium RIFCSPLOWO2_01_FULL_38_11b]|uniref:Uncharacterized protein n=1 Tax=Candidatus Curtissbacteria bacterium RIFCSPLOWO2_01_FULL_38_11b TaxID=1797725 RepID=A0A1F5H1M0_9BACT|nr:MAG: hypothetical protein A3A49_00725 [Candidatus Curtissbacteria bacterium RIFCSPLOWO2_01_FULL_38_11b]
MNTDDKPQDAPPTSPKADLDQSDASGQALVDLVDTMNSVDTNSPQAQANETSMDDNNGKRIEYVENDTDKPDSLNKTS